MADSKTPTSPLPAEQGQPARPSTFDASWDAADASVFDPTTLPLAKAPRAWERQPHSPFARNSRYRKVWKRTETRTTRSKTKAGDDKETTKKGEQTGTHTPRKVVKKRVLDALSADTTATPGRVRPKSKAFAATRYDSPRRQSGRIARKLVSAGLSGSSSDAYGSVWTGSQAQKNTMGTTRAQDIDGRDAQSTDISYTETITPATQDSTTSEAVPEGTRLGAEQKPAPAFISGEEESRKQVVERETAGQDQGEVIQDSNDDEGTEGNAIPDPEVALLNNAPLETGVDDSESSGDSHDEAAEAAAMNTDQEAAKLEEVAEEQQNHLERTECRPEVSEEETTIEGQTSNETPERIAKGARGESVPGFLKASVPLVKESRAAPETAGPDMPASSAQEPHNTADTTPGAEDETAGVPDMRTDTDADTDIAESDAHWFSVVKAKQAERDVQRANIEVAQGKSLGTAEITLKTEDPSFTQEKSGHQPQLEEELAEAEQTDVEIPKKEPALADDANNGNFPQATPSPKQQEPTRRPNLEFSASSLFDEAPDPSDQEREQEVDQDTNLSDEYDDAENSLIDVPSPSLSNNESPRFASVADTLTLNLPDKLYSKDEEPSDEDPSLDSPTDADTAYLREFLSRSDAAKAERATISKRMSLTNRRDSDRVRQALASPRVALETKDPNSPLSSDSPSKRPRSEDGAKSSEAKKLRLEADANALISEMASGPNDDIAADLILVQNTSQETEATLETKTMRRSSRARTTRLAPTPSASEPNRIPVRRADGTTPVVLKKTAAQELAITTRINTRRNKGGAVAAPARLKKLQAEALKAESSPTRLLVCSDPNVEVFEAGRIKWDQQLVYFQEKENSFLESLSDDELATGGVDESLKLKKAATPCAKRTRGPGASNGTPAKGLLAPSNLLPEEVIKETEPAKTGLKKTTGKGGRRKKSSTKAKEEVQKDAITSDPLPSTVGSAEKPRKETPIPLPKPNPPKFPPSQLPTPAAAKKSRLQSPRKIKLPEPAPPAARQAQNKANGVGITGGTPRKIPVTRLSATSSESSNVAAGRGMSVGQRRRAGRRA